jgi:hydrogenase assembly chaperone HypC/HupF
MCLTSPGLVTATGDGTALVRIEGITRTALTLLTPDVQVGDWVLVGAGAVIRRIRPDEAESTRHALDALSTPATSTHDEQGGPP